MLQTTYNKKWEKGNTYHHLLIELNPLTDITSPKVAISTIENLENINVYPAFNINREELITNHIIDTIKKYNETEKRKRLLVSVDICFIESRVCPPYNALNTNVSIKYNYANFRKKEYENIKEIREYITKTIKEYFDKKRLL